MHIQRDSHVYLLVCHNIVLLLLFVATLLPVLVEGLIEEYIRHCKQIAKGRMLEGWRAAITVGTDDGCKRIALFLSRNCIMMLRSDLSLFKYY